MENQKAHPLEAASLPGRRYMEDKPEDCAFCYWWKPGKKCCGREECFYLLPSDADLLTCNPAESPSQRDLARAKKRQGTYGDCRYCPYGKHSPCIGFCLAKILLEMGVRDG